MIEVQRADDRYPGGDAGAGIETRHAFSFGGHYDPANVRFGLLLACNEERLAPGSGFAEHPHRDTEIVTWVLEGELEHRSGDGPAARLGAGDLQRLSAGGGVRHVERNAGPGPLRFLQMWLHPDAFGQDPDYAVLTDPAPPGPGLRLVASGAPVAAGTSAPGARGGAPRDGGPAPAVRLRQRGAALHVGRPAADDDCALPAAPFVYVHVVGGRIEIGGRALGPGHAARIRDEPGVRARTRGPAQYLVWEMHGEPSYG